MQLNKSYLNNGQSFSSLQATKDQFQKAQGYKVGNTQILRSSFSDQVYVHSQRAIDQVYLLADSVTQVSQTVGAGQQQVLETANQVTEKAGSGGPFGFIADLFETTLKTLNNGLESAHVPYSYGFAIVLLTVLVKIATFPLTKQQVESSAQMQALSPKVKAIQEKYKGGNQQEMQVETARVYKEANANPLAGCVPAIVTIPIFIGLYNCLQNAANEGLLSQGFFWIPSLAGPTSLAARQAGGGMKWLTPFIDGQPPLGWHDTLAYLSMPVMLIITQFASFKIMQPPATTPQQEQQQKIFQFLPLVIGYFSLNVPAGLTLYWIINNVISTGQQVYLKQARTAMDGKQMQGNSNGVVGTQPEQVISSSQNGNGVGNRIGNGVVQSQDTQNSNLSKKEKKNKRSGEKFRALQSRQAVQRAKQIAYNAQQEAQGSNSSQSQKEEAQI